VYLKVGWVGHPMAFVKLRRDSRGSTDTVFYRSTINSNRLPVFYSVFRFHRDSLNGCVIIRALSSPKHSNLQYFPTSYMLFPSETGVIHYM
jgi:hypothetical protein